ncbi:hypothetical protein CHS0354_021509 [Potamilus streckersoni]|uniref:Uncharacterized protein n=1 Tax=Potamilus streckersoni TaxID=2493646 RepID=A0AAE0VTB4_9BIVA|nr:hypothetical protein CHS0354_021509 [Potamilus streckersoni]
MGYIITFINILVSRVTRKVKRGDVSVLFVPLYHIFGLHCALSSELALGMTIVIMSKFTIEEYYILIQTHKASLIHIVPPVAVMIVNSPLLDKYDLSSVRHVMCGAAALKTVVEIKLKERLNLDCIYQGYGMTEMGVSHANTDTFYKMGSCGKALRGVEVKIEDPKTKVILGANLRGEICIKGPQVMLGYLGRPDANREIFDKEGWLHTGDVGYVDEDGFLFIVDRLKEIIKYKGNQVPPAYLEDILLKHPGVKDAAVVGVPDAHAGELPKAFVVRNDGMNNVDEQQIFDFVEDRVPPYMKLRGGVEFIREIPKNPTGKILRRKLREFPMRDENDNIDNGSGPIQVHRL